MIMGGSVNHTHISKEMPWIELQGVEFLFTQELQKRGMFGGEWPEDVWSFVGES